MDEIKTLTLRIPEILYARIRTQVDKRKQTIAKFALNDWVIEACRERLDGPEPTIASHTSPGMMSAERRSAAQLAASIPGVSLGIPDPGSFVVIDEWEDRCIAEFGRKILVDAARTIRNWARWDWQQRHNHLAELKEAQAGG